MNKLLLASGAVWATLSLPAQAEVLLDPHLSGTGINVVTEGVNSNDVIGGFNGQNQDTVLFNDLAVGFTSATSGNDIKIGNTPTIFFAVFDPSNNLLGTTTEVFSLSGSGDVSAKVIANDGTFSFDLGTIGNGQSGFTFNAINGESILGILLTDTGGMISDFEHNRIELAAVATPLPGALPLFATGLAGLGLLGWRRKRKALA